MVIFIGGSWGIGHWTNNELTGPGIAQYFGMTDTVLNLCRSGDSNLDQLNKLSSIADKINLSNQDKIYWLVHNPIVNEPPTKLYQDHDSLADSIGAVLHEQMAVANNFARNKNLFIELIGASCDLNHVDLDQYTNLYVKLASWAELLDKTYPVSVFSHQADHMHELRKNLETHRPDLLDEYYKIGGQAFAKRRSMLQRPDLFSSFHPTSWAHQQLREFLAT